MFRSWLIACAAAFIGLWATCRHLDADWLPESTTARLVGMRPHEVSELLGEPTRIDPTEDQTERWS